MQLLFPFDYFLRRYLSHDFHSYLLGCVQHQRELIHLKPFSIIFCIRQLGLSQEEEASYLKKMGKVSLEPTESHYIRQEFNQDKRLTRASINNYVMFDRVNREQCKRLLANCVLLNQ